MHETPSNALITTKEELEHQLSLTEEELAFDYHTTQTLPLRIPSYFLDLIDKHDVHDPLRLQVVPKSAELICTSQEDIDPLAEVTYSVTRRLIHRYPSRVAFLTTDICPIHCRHCFRRRFTGTFQGPATDEQIEEASAYVAGHPEVKEILFTGGDVLTLSDARLKQMIAAFRSKRKDLVIRLCTRMPASYPMRITKALISMLGEFSTAPFYLMTQFNHPKELTEQAIKAAIEDYMEKHPQAKAE